MTTFNNALPKIHKHLLPLSDEIHSRSFPKIQGAVILSQVTMIHKGDCKQEQIDHLTQLANIYHVTPPDPNTSCYYQDLGEIDVRWEYHTEFSTYTFLRLNENEKPFACPPWQVLPTLWREQLPGALISATHIDIQTKQPANNELQQIFAGHPIAACFVAEQNARVIASFKTNECGFDKIIVIDEHLTQTQTGRLLRCLLELSSYRVMALLSLPVSKTLLPLVSDMEKQLANITMQVSQSAQDGHEQKELLVTLSTLSANLENIIAENQYRFDASAAYFDILTSRLEELRESELSGVSSISDFLMRRLTPAIKTGKSIQQRTLDLSTRIEKTSDLLRTKINLKLEEQNQDLLKALNRRSHMQLRLQQLVESVSMIAISYYVVQLLSYMLVLPKRVTDVVNKAQIIAFCVPVVVFLVFFVLQKIKKSWRKQSNSD